MPASTANDMLIDSHEKRLQNVEQSLNECTAELAKNSSKVEEIGEKIRVSGDNVADKIETLVKTIDKQFEAQAEGLKAQVEAMKALVSEVNNHGTRLTKIEIVEKARIERRVWFKRIGTAIVTLILGGLATKGLGLVLAHFGIGTGG